MPKHRIIALEGLPFTGKSTASASLQRTLGGVAIVADYHELIAPDDRQRMATLSDSAADQVSRVNMYRRLDDHRWDLARGSRHQVIVFDRCYVSIAAYRVALHQTFGARLWNQSRQAQVEAIDRQCERKVPREILYFGVDLDVAVDRHRRLSTMIDQRLRTRDFLSNLIDAYQEVLKDCGSEVTYIDSNRPLDEVVGQVMNHVRGT
jgi:thymidylate kinase